jgi:arylformamidase
MDYIYKSFDQEELDSQYRASATVPNMKDFIDEYASLSATARKILDCRIDLKFGPGAEETLDLFPASTLKDAPLFIFIHGGYWRMLSKNESSFMAPNLVDHGVAVAAINYTLVPPANIDQIVVECRRAIKWLYQNAASYGINPNRIYVGGSSAGGHLTGMMVAGGWQEEYGLPTDVIKGGVPMSGLFEMEPVVKCFVNEWMQMSMTDGIRNSPAQNLPTKGCPLIVAVGGDETDEFRRQSKDFADLWKSRGWPSDYLECQGVHHFNAPLELCNPNSLLTQKLLAMVGC